MSGLFPELEDDDGDDRERVELVMLPVHQTDKAWLLKRSGRQAGPQWIPKSRTERGAPPDEDVFTMARGDARERGWL